MIPRIIHYCWFGKSPFPEIVVLCINSWKRNLPYYEIKRWDESNSPMEVNWVKDACYHRKYAFAADYVRFYALYNEGGIYLDTDMYITKSLDCFLSDDTFMGFEDENAVNMAIVGSIKGDLFMKKCMNFYESGNFDILRPIIITRLVTNYLRQINPRLNGSTNQFFDGKMIYKPEYFYPIHYSERFLLNEFEKHLYSETHAIHFWNQSWEDEFILLSKKKYNEGFRMAFKRIIRSPILPLKYYKKLFKYLYYYLIRH